MIFENFKNIPNNLDVANIGSGISYNDFVWDIDIDLKGHNFAICPEDFRYDARIIKKYGKHLKSGAVVIIVVCPLSFGKNEYLYEDFFSEKYVDLLPKEDVDVSKLKYFLFSKIKSLYSFHVILRKIPIYIKAKIRRLFKMSSNESSVDIIIKGWIHDSPGLSDLRNPNQAEKFVSVFEEKKADLRKVVDNCLVQNLVPVILIPPISDSLYSRMSPEFLKAFMYDNISEEVARGIKILDYLRDETFMVDSNYKNGLFLTEEKKVLFTKRVISDIKESVL